MIKKISRIKNIGSFWLFDWNEINPDNCRDSQGNIITNSRGNPKRIQHEFRKYNILFGENGSGKTMLISIFKSLNNNNSKDLNKHWDKENEDREVQIEFNASIIAFEENSGWDSAILEDRFIFFDRNFISNYVHSGVTGRGTKHEQNTGKMMVYLGDFYDYQEQLDRFRSFRDFLRERNTAFEKLEEQKYDLLFSNIVEISKDDIEGRQDMVETLNVENREEYKESLGNKEEELRKLEKAFKGQKKVENISILEPIKSPIIYSWFNLSLVNSLFGFTVEGTAIKILDKIQSKKDFIQRGVELIEKKSLTNCPLCEQKIRNGDYIEIIKQYQHVFDKEFNNSQQQAKKWLEEYKKFLADILNISTSIVLVNNQQKFAEINQYLTAEKEFPVLDSIQEEQNIIREEIGIVQDKEKRILSYLESENLERIKQIAEKLLKFIDNYNCVVQETNKILEQYKRDLRRGKKQEEKEKLLQEIKQLKINLFIIGRQKELLRYFRSVKCYQKNQGFSSNLDKIFNMLRNEINYRFKEFTELYFEKTRRYIEKISPVLHLEMKCKAQYHLGTTSPVICGFEVHYKGKDRLAELSEGERQVIALAFFFALLDNEKHKTDKIVVFDDPITSFDAGKRRSTAELIQYETYPFLQTFIFTCDPLFKRYCIKVRNYKAKYARNQYYILRSGSSSVHYVSKNRATICASFKTDFRNVKNVPAGTDEDIVVYGQKLRFCIETDVKEKLGYDEDSLNSVLNKVQKPDFDRFKIVIDKIRDIYSYCNTGGLAHYPRDGATSWVELTNWIKRYLALNL